MSPSESCCLISARNAIAPARHTVYTSGACGQCVVRGVVYRVSQQRGARAARCVACGSQRTLLRAARYPRCSLFGVWQRSVRGVRVERCPRWRLRAAWCKRCKPLAYATLRIVQCATAVALLHAARFTQCTAAQRAHRAINQSGSLSHHSLITQVGDCHGLVRAASFTKGTRPKAKGHSASALHRTLTVHSSGVTTDSLRTTDI